MNITLATPIMQSNLSCQKPNSQTSRPVFTGKNITAKQAKQSKNLAQKIYELLYVPSKEKLVEINDGTVKTRLQSGSKITTKKYALWSKAPSEVVEVNQATLIGKKQIMNPDGTCSVEIRDMHTPNYKISAGYENVHQKNSTFDFDYEGPVTIKYCDEELVIDNNKRKELVSSLSKSLDEKYSERINGLLKDKSAFKSVYQDFYHDPDKIGLSILTSPGNLEKQLELVPSSMPYGMERILEMVK